MNQNRPLPPDEQEWHPEKQNSLESLPQDETLRLTPEDLAGLRTSMSQVRQSQANQPVKQAPTPDQTMNFNPPISGDEKTAPEVGPVLPVEATAASSAAGNGAAPGSTTQAEQWQREKQGPPPSAEELAWQREKQLAPVSPPPPPQRPYQPLGTPNQNFARPQPGPEEVQWQREKQAYPGLTPQDLEWQREKQAYPTGQLTPSPVLSPEEVVWQREKQNYPAHSAQEIEWQREKQVYPGLTPQELEWQREKQASPGLSAQELEWQREKQTYPVLTPQELEWQREKQGQTALVPVGYQNAALAVPTQAVPVAYSGQTGLSKPKPAAKRSWWWLGLLLLLLVAGLVAVLFFVLGGKDAGSATPTPGAALTGGSSQLDPAQATINAANRATQTAGATDSQNEGLYSQGKSAYDDQRWPDAIGFFEKVAPESAAYSRVKPLLANAYFNQANNLALKSTTSASLTQAIDLYNKAVKLEPDNTSFKAPTTNATLYQSGLTAVTGKKWETAVDKLGQLYRRKPDFRDTVQLYYTSLESRGDELAGAGNLKEARDIYANALALDFKGNPPDQTALKAKMAGLDEKLKPTVTPAPAVTSVPTATPAPTSAPTAVPLPVPTATRLPLPTVTPRKAAVLAPCDKGGSGSNFFAFRTNQPKVPDVKDQGRSGVRGVVLSKQGAPIAGATVRMSTTGFSFTSVTDGGGNYFREGLGRGAWTISVVGAPSRTICYAANGSVMLSGQSGFYASVDFTESVP